MKTIEQKKQWMTDHIGMLDFVQNGTQHVVALPSAYRIALSRPLPRLINIFAEISPAVRLRCVPTRLEATADSRDESIGLLFRKVSEAIFQDGEIDIYKPKKNQTQDVLKPGKMYSVINFEDPLHDHASPALIDFSILVAPCNLANITLLDYDSAHCHLLDPKFS